MYTFFFLKYKVNIYFLSVCSCQCDTNVALLTFAKWSSNFMWNESANVVPRLSLSGHCPYIVLSIRLSALYEVDNNTPSSVALLRHALYDCFDTFSFSLRPTLHVLWSFVFLRARDKLNSLETSESWSRCWRVTFD